MNQVRRKGIRSFFRGRQLWHISRILRSLDSGSFPSRCLPYEYRLSSASLLSDMWLPGGDDAASLLPSCGPTSVHACVVLGVCTLFCESTFPYSHTHTHTPFSGQIRPRLNFRHGQPPNTTNMEDAVDASPGEAPKAFKSLLGILEKYVT